MMVTTVRKRSGRSERGQALLEMALVTPLVLALALGVIEMGRYAYLAILVGNAAHAGAAFGAQGPTYAADPTAIQAAADNDFQGNGQSSGTLTIQSSISCACDSDTDGSISMQTDACSSRANNSIDQTINACTTGGGHWVATVSVEADGRFRSLFDYPGIPRRITVDRTATMRVAQ